MTPPPAILPTVNHRPRQRYGCPSRTLRGSRRDRRLWRWSPGQALRELRPPEDSCIRSRPPRRSGSLATARTMNTNDWTQHPHFAALDWASDHHDVALVDRTGALVAEFRFAHTAAGWAEFTEKMQPYTGAPLALETSSGPAVDQLLQRGWALYPVNPKAAQRDRERKAPSGTKTDAHDTWSLADARRTDGHGWRKLLPQDEATATLRALRRDELALIEQRTALVNQLLAGLREYYPVALELFDDWTQPCAWALLAQFPTPAQLQATGKRSWDKFLHTQRLWRSDTAPARLALMARACWAKWAACAKSIPTPTRCAARRASAR